MRIEEMVPGRKYLHHRKIRIMDRDLEAERWVKYIEKTEKGGILLSGKLNDALSGRLFYADFGSHGGNSHFKNGCFCELFS